MAIPKYHIGDFVRIVDADRIRAECADSYMTGYKISWSYEQIKWSGFHAKVKGFRCIDHRIYYMLDGVFDIPIYLWSEEFLEPAAK